MILTFLALAARSWGLVSAAEFHIGRTLWCKSFSLAFVQASSSENY
jgi:hypothetical protein